MKEQDNSHKKKFYHKIFIKICRLFGYEIIDQSTYEVPSLNKNIGDTLSSPGRNSIVLPLGEFKITRKIKSLKVFFRSCTSELIMDQNKKRIFNKEKNEYTFRSLYSLLKSLDHAKKIFESIDFELIVTDTNSNKNDLEKIKKILSNHNIPNKLIEINLDDFKDKIIGNYSKAKFANMANLYSSLLLSKDDSSDVIYFCEDDYLHSKVTILEMLFSYEKFSTMFKKDIFLLPSDYPYLYTKSSNTKLFVGHKSHWRLVDESLVTFMTSKKIVLEYIDNFMAMATKWEDPWEKPLHNVYKKIPCLSPIPSLAIHCANINSAYGLSPNIDWKMIWDENENY
ncbi:glycosyltransferase family 2 protein [bacterium]|nr:glycosyltransferase family 2 protein [bacterium]